MSVSKINSFVTIRGKNTPLKKTAFIIDLGERSQKEIDALLKYVLSNYNNVPIFCRCKKGDGYRLSKKYKNVSFVENIDRFTNYGAFLKHCYLIRNLDDYNLVLIGTDCSFKKSYIFQDYGYSYYGYNSQEKRSNLKRISSKIGLKINEEGSVFSTAYNIEPVWNGLIFIPSGQIEELFDNIQEERYSYINNYELFLMENFKFKAIDIKEVTSK